MYVVKKDIIASNVKDIRNAFERCNIPLILSYSCKTNSMSCVLNEMSLNNVIFEVVSEHEYNNTEDIGMARRKICNGVAMTHTQTASCIKTGDLVNFNDVTQAEEVRKALNNRDCYEVGIRVNFGDSRFGVKADDLGNAINKLNEMNYNVECLHCHISGTRPLDKYKRKVSNMVDLLIKYNLHPRYIDFGGNMYGKMSNHLALQFDDVASFNDYAIVISNELKRLDYTPTVILELGTALIANAVDIVGNVIRVDEYNRVVLDIDVFTIGMMKNKNIEYTFISNDNSKKPHKAVYNVYGCTCIEDDVLISNFEGSVCIGDKFVFHNCGAYSYCFEPDFIIPRQEVVII